MAAVDLTVDINGISYPNPLIVASGPPTLNPNSIIKCFENGAGGAVTKTITFDPMQQIQPKPRMYVLNKKDAFAGKFYSFYSIDLMSEYKPDKWVVFLKDIKRKMNMQNLHGVLIASIAGRTYEEWGKLAEMMSADADALELNLSCPHIEKEESGLMGRAATSSPEIVKNIIKTVKENSSIPVIGKLTPHGANPLELAKIMVSAGVDALVSTARFQGLVIDAEALKVVSWGGFGGYGGPWQLPISLSWTAHIINENLGVPVIGSGGVTSGEDIAKFLLVGAHAVQCCTTLVLMGHEIIPKMLSELKDWIVRHGFTKIEDFRGYIIKKGIIKTENLNKEKIYIFSVTQKCIKCGICVRACPYEAIQLDSLEKAKIDYNQCDNCGLCLSICPVDAIEMTKRG
ncbi:MAG: 4Fe-4S binding protein [Candidatus Methanomethylicia archaeon]